MICSAKSCLLKKKGKERNININKEGLRVMSGLKIAHTVDLTHFALVDVEGNAVYSVVQAPPDIIFHSLCRFRFPFSGVFIVVFGILHVVHLRSKSIQFKMVSKRSGKPVCAPPRLSEVSPMLPLQYWSD